jgi:hypothetical protein
MLELLFFVALLGWVAVSSLQYLAALPAGPAILAALVLVPPLALLRGRRLLTHHHLDFLQGHRRPLPPERFFWPTTRRRLGLRTLLMAVIAVTGWSLALGRTERLAADWVSVSGWLAAACGSACSVEFLAACWLYLRASQRFDPQAPGLVGWARRALYRISDNHEFLGEEPLPREKRKRESVY